VEDLRKANRLVGNGDHALYQRMVLRVPVKPLHGPQNGEIDLAAVNLLKRRTIARFARKSGCNNLDEAQYYLETHHFNFDAALAEFLKDAQVALPTPPETISSRVHSISKTKVNRSCCFSMA